MKRLFLSPLPLALTASLAVIIPPVFTHAQQQTAQAPAAKTSGPALARDQDQVKAPGSAPAPAAPAVKSADPVQTQAPAHEKASDKRSPEPTANAASDAQVQGLLFFASNDPNAPAQEEKVTVDAAMLTPLDGRLKKVFPFSNFHLIGKHTQKVFKEYESWVVPSKDLCLKIDSRGPAEGGGVNVHLQLWQDTKVLVKSDSVIRPGQPIFLGGPKWRGGRLIFVVMLKG
ncbi:MAG: hypothetical protein JWM59_4698 [Verrucomicrobiales bacterium]|nr:hypothetical protein [Verrucomicrobiales bacterium]